ncbi:MAG: hypothetical protein NTU95_03730 [Methanothrix sp.]|nr:hypothetical protein [Methanothrix sp.]
MNAVIYVGILSLLLLTCAGAVAQDTNSTQLVAPSPDSGDAFPDGEAGIAAYISTGQVVDLEKIKTIFSSVEKVGDNYIVGVVQIPDWGGNIPVHLYADTDGWMVSYLKKDEPVSEVMQWGSSDADNPTLGVIKSTTLEDALYKAGDAAGVGIVATGIKYYDFEFPNANQMMIIAKTQATAGSSIHQIEIPENYMLFDASYYHYVYYLSDYGNYGGYGNYFADSILKVDSATISDAATSYQGDWVLGWWRSMDQYKGAISPGSLHTIEISYTLSDTGSAGVATVLIYRTT